VAETDSQIEITFGAQTEIDENESVKQRKQGKESKDGGDERR
jgi:hypothetical protein